MFYVRFKWRHRFNCIDETTFWNSQEKAEEMFDKILSREYKKIFKKKPSTFFSSEDIFECINARMEQDLGDRYLLECEFGEIIPQDEPEEPGDGEEHEGHENQSPKS